MQEYISLKNQLFELNYRENFGQESLPLVKRLIGELLKAFELHKKLKT
jgi:hypothetical protein